MNELIKQKIDKNLNEVISKTELDGFEIIFLLLYLTLFKGEE